MPAAEIILLPDGRTLHKFRAYGLGDMADVTATIPAVSFGLDVNFTLDYLRGWVSGGSGGDAATQTMVLKQKVPDESSGLFDNVVRRFRDFRTAGQQSFIDFRIQVTERQHWTWIARTLLVPEWTNPGNGGTWKLEVGLATFPRRVTG